MAYPRLHANFVDEIQEDGHTAFKSAPVEYHACAAIANIVKQADK
jgi:hypothetical protein